MSTQRTATVNALTALARTIDLGIDARHALTQHQIRDIASWRHRVEPLAHTIARKEATRLARHIHVLDTELTANNHELKALIQASPAACLLDEIGIGPVNAAIIFTAWSHPGRIRTEAGFAALAGACPIPASSGNTTRHRLNRGGDRRLNSALHSIIITRSRHDPNTRDYITRRTLEGRTPKEIRRCLKRYLARKIYRTLEHTQTAPLDKT
jgi:transposase